MDKNLKNNPSLSGMKNEVDQKLSKIADIWNEYILEYKLCNSNVKFTSDVKTNYFGDILGYFSDTFEIVYGERKSDSYTDDFRNNISLLQSIYIQQDFIEELLIIFKCRTTKGDLKLDENYSINREIRNELVGHPIRKPYGDLISSTLFAYDNDKSSITYLRYHKNNNFKFEKMCFSIKEILLRHTIFLNHYFDIILTQLKVILDNYINWLETIESQINKLTFIKLIGLLSTSYESIFNYSKLYDKDSLLAIYERRDKHYRYQNLINNFYQDLKTSIKESKENIKEKFQPPKVYEQTDLPEPISIIFKGRDTQLNNNTKIRKSFHYELGKLATNRDLFTMCRNILIDEFSDNQLVLDELKHMESNLYNDLEYYCSFRVVHNELNDDFNDHPKS